MLDILSLTYLRGGLSLLQVVLQFGMACLLLLLRVLKSGREQL
jgi:hypothetical protein